MREITEKLRTERTATAEGSLTLSEEGRRVLAPDDETRGPFVDKGHLPTIARTVGVTWAKMVPELLPDAHPVDLTEGDIDVQATDEGARVQATCSAVDRTGVELEALAACLGGLFALWDALKPYEKTETGQYDETRIHGVRITEKTKASAGHHAPASPITSSIVVATDSRDEKTDRTGPELAEALEAEGIEVADIERVPDEVGRIRAEVAEAGRAGADLVLAAGGTGPSPRDVTPQAIEKFPGTELPGLTEGLRRWSQAHDGPHALLSRSVCRLVEAGDVRFVAIALPGHPQAVRALAPFTDAITHATDLWRGST